MRFLALLVLAACVSTKATVLNPSARLAPICPDGVMVFSSAEKVGKPFVEVAILSSTGNTDVTSEAGMLNSQRKKAAAVGANGLIMGTVKDPTTGAKVANALLGTGADRKGQAVAIHIVEDSSRVRQACATASE